MKLLFNWHTYEIYYKKEIIRLVFLILLFLSFVCMCVYVKTLPKIVHILLVIIVIYLPFMWCWSIWRISEINENKKKSMPISKEYYSKLNFEFPNCKFLVYANKKYVECDTIDFEYEEVILLRINNKHFKKKEIKKILNNKWDIFLLYNHKVLWSWNR